MVPFCKEHNIRLLAYGSLCGGMMSEDYLRKMQEPSATDLDTLSLRKYKKMVDIWGGWSLFQELLSILNEIAQKHNVSIANVATRYILEKPAVSRSPLNRCSAWNIDHRNSNAQVFNFCLDKSDYDTIDAHVSQSQITCLT